MNVLRWHLRTSPDNNLHLFTSNHISPHLYTTPLQLELVACAEYYATEYYCADGEGIEVDQHAMNESAAQSIASGIEEYFFSDIYENYYEYYVLQTAARLDKTRSERYAKALRLSVPECTLITPKK